MRQDISRFKLLFAVACIYGTLKIIPTDTGIIFVARRGSQSEQGYDVIKEKVREGRRWPFFGIQGPDLDEIAH